MRAVIISEGTISKDHQLKLTEQTLPTPGEGEVLVKLTSIGLNRADWLYPQGKYFFKPQANSRLGFEGAGVIEACGTNSQFKKGDAVAACPMSFDVQTQGCMADYALFKEEQLIPSPKNLTLAQTGAIWMAYLTAWGGMVDAGQLQAGEHVVITAASSSVGIAAIQVAKQVGAISIATTTSQDKADNLTKLGADHVIVQAKGDEGIDYYVDRVRNITQNQGSDLVFDAVAGPASRGLVKASKRGGRIVIQGLLDRRPMDIHAGVLMKRLLTLKGYTLDQTLENPKAKAQAIEDITNGFESGLFTPVIADTFALEDFQKAFDLLLSNKHLGKIVLAP